MPRVEDALRDLIQYHGRKAAAQVFGETAAQLREVRREVRGLRSAVQEIEGILKGLVTAREREMAVPPANEEEVETARFSPRMLKSLRKRLSLTQQELAKLLEVSAVTVAAWETGRSRPRKANLAQVVTLRGMGASDVDTALGRQEAPEAPKPEQLKKLRSHFCITQAELARLLSVSPASVTSWEAGKATPGRINRRAIADLLAASSEEVDQKLGRSAAVGAVPVAVRRRGLTADEIKNLRDKIGLSQKALAQKIGVSVNSISNWETGRTVPRARSVHQMLALAAE
jgi:DNA-binding transcriptional regulator YiaG